MKRIALLLCCLALTGSAFAKTKAKPSTNSEAPRKKPLMREADDNISGQGYGMAGCGLGSIVLGQKGGYTQIFAATTNGTFGSQTFGITFGSSNCKVEEDMHKTAALFIEVNKEALTKDISRGQGESLDNFASVMNCSNPSLLGSKLQQNFDMIFPSGAQSSEQSGSAVREIIRNDAELSKSCNVVG